MRSMLEHLNATCENFCMIEKITTCIISGKKNEEKKRKAVIFGMRTILLSNNSFHDRVLSSDRVASMREKIVFKMLS